MSDDRSRDVSFSRRHSPPYAHGRSDAPLPAAGIQIRGLARDREIQYDRDERRLEQRREYWDRGHRHGFNDRDDPDRNYRAQDGRQYRRSPSPQRYDRRGYQDRDRNGYRSPEHDRQSGNSSPRRRERSPFYGGEPSKEVILEGLPAQFAEDDIKRELLKHHGVDSLDEVRLIRDRKTGVSRQFGFIRFPSVKDATAFLERNYPSIKIHDTSDTQDSQGNDVRVAFSRERGERGERVEREPTQGEWRCLDCGLPNYPRRTECFKCHTPRTSSADPFLSGQTKLPNFKNTGDSDVSTDSAPSQFVLFRGLEASVTEELLLKGASKLFVESDFQTKLQPGKIVSTSTVAQAGAQPGTIRRVLLIKDKRTGNSWRYGFVEYMTVADAQAAVTKYNSMDKFTISSKPVLVGYIHAGVFVPELRPTAQSDEFTFAASTNPSLRLKYWDEDARVSELVVSTESPDAPNAMQTDESDAALQKAGKADGKVKKRKAEGVAAEVSKKSMPSTLQFWTNRHAELHGITPATAEGNDKSDNAVADPGSATVGTETPPSRSYADPVRNCCYLCSRQFKTAAEVNKHERLSTLHQDNMKNEELVAKAGAKMDKIGGQAFSTEGNAQEYRDRAKERRAAFNQPKKGQGNVAATAKPRNKPTSEPKKEEEAVPVVSKGAALLGKMGWTAGAGLGREGTGTTAAISTDLYASGVGLGAEGGRIGDAVEEAARASRGDYAEFAEKTRDRARERFERMA